MKLSSFGLQSIMVITLRLELYMTKVLNIRPTAAQKVQKARSDHKRLAAIAMLVKSRGTTAARDAMLIAPLEQAFVVTAPVTLFTSLLPAQEQILSAYAQGSTQQVRTHVHT